MRAWTRVLPLGLLLGTGPVPAAQVAGWVESVTLRSPRLTLDAKLDTGAENSSLHAEGIERLPREGREQVRFRVHDGAGRAVVLERPLVREAVIRRAGGESQRRPVVRLALCLGGVEREVEVNLVDRGGLDYRLLLGRSFLVGEFLVDSASIKRLPSDCPP